MIAGKEEIILDAYPERLKPPYGRGAFVQVIALCFECGSNLICRFTTLRSQGNLCLASILSLSLGWASIARLTIRPLSVWILGDMLARSVDMIEFR